MFAARFDLVRSSLALAGALAALLPPSGADATTMPALTLEDLTLRATDIVQGTVTDLTPRWSDGFLMTDVTVEVTTCIKGACLADSVQVQVFGGTADGYVVEAAGSARYAPGEQVMLFLEPVGGTGQVRLRTAGMALGKFHVALAGDLPVVERSLEGLELLGPAREVAVAENRLALDELERRIASVLAP
jgi:hypothetical protein